MSLSKTGPRHLIQGIDTKINGNQIDKIVYEKFNYPNVILN